MRRETDKCDKLEQYQRRDNVRVFGVLKVRGEDVRGVAREVACGVSEEFAQGQSLYRSVS